MVKRRKIGFAILVAVLYLAGTSPASVFAQAETLMLQEAIAGGISADADIREAKQALMKANASLNEAFYAILNSMEKDMFLIPMQQRSITRDVELALKSAESMKALVIAEAELEAAERKVRADVERLYVTAYQSQRVVKRAGQRLAERKHALQETELLHRFGRASREQVEAAREAVKQAESELKQAQLSYNRDKIELGTRIGRELERVDLELRVERYYVPLTQDAMWRFVHKALRDDLELVKANEEMKLAEAKVAAVRAAMSRKFTPLMTASIEAMFDGTEQYVTGEIHYDMLIAELDSMIFTADALWYTVIPIPIPVPPFVLPLPLKPIQGEHDGARYFEDERLILPNSMMELDTARQRVHDLRQDVVQNIKTSYLNAKQAEETYAQMLRLKAQAERALKAAEQQRRFGVYTEEQLAGEQAAYEEAEQAAFDAYVAYRDALSALDLVSAGALTSQRIPGILPWDHLEESGTEPLDQAPPTPQPLQGGWAIRAVENTIKSEFSLEVEGSAFGAEMYSLHSRDGFEIGKTRPLDEAVAHLSFVFANIKDLRVYFYDADGEIIAEARLDGYGNQGKLDMVLTNE